MWQLYNNLLSSTILQPPFCRLQAAVSAPMGIPVPMAEGPKKYREVGEVNSMWKLDDGLSSYKLGECNLLDSYRGNRFVFGSYFLQVINKSRVNF